ncbi:hypothetical protein [Dyella sp. ASV21]|uniref:hypothetical protein n=1 Tax=Dyella sp. ASV21 TaxID=2795114 RepID=UPI0018EAD9C3|nr:hypothetical protein [Dyella sp. ASV21]
MPAFVINRDRPGSSHRPRRVLRAALAWAGAGLAAHANAYDPDARGATSSSSSDQLAIQVNNDRMTLAVAKVPQVYLYGRIDTDAPRRVDELIKSGKIPPGSDIYLNATGGDMASGLALGRLFRAGSLATHLGVPRRTARMPIGPRAAQCIDACAYAYLGGLYRWAPTGNDRFGVQRIGNTGAAAPDEVSAYLKDMGIRPELVAAPATTPAGDVHWFDGDQMMAGGLANNGRLPTTASYHPMIGATSLSLSQVARDGEHRITLLCRPDGMTLTAYYMVGAERSRKIAARITHSYFEIDRQPTPQGERDGVATVNQSLVFSHPVSVDQLGPLLSAHSMGAWLADRGGAVRYGFALDLDAVRNNLRDYSASCRQLAKQTPPTHG